MNCGFNIELKTVIIVENDGEDGLTVKGERCNIYVSWLTVYGE